VGRHIRLTDAATLDDPAVGELMDDAVDLADVQIGAGQKAKIVIRMAAETPRRRGSPAQH
jgi:hypothetical protein